MLVAAAFVPSPPLLLAALGGGPADLRSACEKAIWVLDRVDRVVVVGAAPESGRVTGTVDATPYGAAGPPAADPLPLSLAVGATLLGGRPHELVGVGTDANRRQRGCPEVQVPTFVRGEPTGLLVVGDGSARRSDKAPGHLDPRAEPFDRSIENALAAGDPDALLDLDADLADTLLVGGRLAWQVASAAALAEVAPGRAAPLGWRGEVHYAAAPYGVFYPVATWVPVSRA